MLAASGEGESAEAVAPREMRRLLGMGGRCWHVRARPCTEGEMPLAGAVALYYAWPISTPRSAARARTRACCASSRERESAVAPVPPETQRMLGVRGRSWHVGARPCTVGETPLTVAVALYIAMDRPHEWTDHKPRSAPRARGKHACCASSRERESAVVPAPSKTRRLLGVESCN